MIFRVPTHSSKIKVMKCGKAFGFWNGRNDTFQFKLPRTVCAAEVMFTSTSGVYKFHFDSNTSNASHVPWEHLDYDYENEAFLLDRAFTRRGKHPQISELPFPRVRGFTDYYNPTRPSHLVRGALVRHRRSYSSTEIRDLRNRDMEQSPAYVTRRRARSVSRSYSRSPSRSTSSSRSSRSPFDGYRMRSPPRKIRISGPPTPVRRDSLSNSVRTSRSYSRSYSRSPSRSPIPMGVQPCVPAWVRNLRALPEEHSKFIWDIVSFIKDVDHLYDFAMGIGIHSSEVRRAIADNKPIRTNMSLDDCIAQTLTDWWVASDETALWKSDRIRQGFEVLKMKGLYLCIIARHPALDPFRAVRNLDGSLPGSSGQMSNRPNKTRPGKPARYLSMEYIRLNLKESECNALADLACLIKTPDAALGVSVITNLPDPTFVYICSEQALYAQKANKSDDLLQSEIAFHILAIWYIFAKDDPDRWDAIRDMFDDMDLDLECTEVLESYPWTKSSKGQSQSEIAPFSLKQGKSILKKEPNSKSSANQVGTCSPICPSESYGENGESDGVGDQIPPLIDENENTGASDGDVTAAEFGVRKEQPLITFGQAKLNNMGNSTQTLEKSVNVTFALDRNDTKTLPNPYVKLQNVDQRAAGDGKVFSD